MFDNLIESINSQLPLSDLDKEQIKSVEKKPDLSFFPDQQSTKDENSDSNALKLERDKASFLKFLRTCYLCPKNNIYYQLCDSVVTHSSRSLPTILSQLSDYQFIVGPETIIAFQSRMVQDKCNDDYQVNLVKAAMSCPKYMQPIYCFAILQLFRFRELYDNPDQKYVTLPNSVQKSITKKIFSPILLASFLTQNGSAEVDRIIKRFDIFQILAEKWIGRAEKILDKEVMKICLEEIFFFLSRFARLYIRSLLSQSPQVVTNRIIPLMCKIVSYSPELFEKLINDIDLFASRHITDYCFHSLLTFLAQACKSSENAETILAVLVMSQNRPEPLMVQYFAVLNEAHDQIVNSNVDDGPLASMILLSRFFKYLQKPQLYEIVKLFDPSDVDHPELSFISFLSTFMKNPTLSPYASKVLMYATEIYPAAIYDYLSAPGSMKDMEINFQTAKSYIKACKTLIAFSFCRESPLPCKGIPQFIKDVVLNFFQTSLYERFDTRSQRWSTLTSFLETVYDIISCDRDFCIEIQKNDISVKHLLFIIHHTSLIMQKPPMIERESDSHRLDNDKFRIIIQFDCVALALLNKLVTSNLADPNQDLSYLCQSFFSNDIDGVSSDERSTFFTVLISFLEITNPLASRLHLYALQMLDLLCEIAGRMPSISVDSFYPHSSQRILKEFIKTNLFKMDGNTNIEQNINVLDFLTHSLSSQVAFAYSFIHRLGTSLLSAAIDNLGQIASQYPDWLLSITRLLSMMFQKLNLDSNTIQSMTKNANFWTNILNVLKGPLPNNKSKCQIIASKAELLNILQIGKPDEINAAILNDLLSNVQQVLPNTFDPIMDVDVDMTKFLTVGLHPVYGNNFYIDAELFKRYLVDGDEIVNKTIELNNQLSIIDASTQVIASIERFLKTSTDKTMFPSVKNSLGLLIKVIGCDIYPDSTIQLCFNLVERSLFVVSEAIPGIPAQLLTVFGTYLSETPLKSSFSTIANLLTVSLIDFPEELMSMLEPCIRYALSSTQKPGKDVSSSVDALRCASEIALKLVMVDKWLESIPIIEESFPIFFHSEPQIACAALDFLSVVLTNEQNAFYLESKGFFEQFLCEVPCHDDSHSPIWLHLFNMFTAFPKTQSSLEFVSTHLNYIEFFLINSNEREMIHSESTSDSQLMWVRVQMVITQLLQEIAKQFRSLSQTENPVQYERLIKVVSERLRKSFLSLREAHLKIGSDQINEYDILSRNEKACHLVILRNCLLFFNKLFDFPLGKPPLIVMHSEKSSDQILDMMCQIANDLQEILVKDSDCYSNVTFEAFELALRIYVAKMFGIAGSTNGLKKIAETRKPILKTINAVKSLIEKNQIDNQESYQLLNEMYSFIRLVK